MRDLAIRRVHPEVVTINGGKQAWDDNGKEVELDEELILQEIEKIKEEYKAVEYKELRKLEYPSIEECVHALLDDKLEELQAKRLAVKEKYPKPVVEEPIVEEPKEEPKVEQPIEEVPSE